MKLKLAILVLFAGFAVSACNKKKDPESSPVSSTSVPSNPEVFSGIFTAGTYTNEYGLISTTSYNQAFAYFTTSPQPSVNSASGVSVNVVSINNNTLTFQPTQNYYYSSVTISIVPEKWSVNGASGIGTFSFTNSAPAPNASGIFNLPKTFSKNSGFNANILNVANVKEGILIIDDGTGDPEGSITYTVTNGNNVINIIPNTLSALATTTNANVILTLRNKNVQVFSGKNYQFINENRYSITHATITP
jgi:hypothetical protein